MKWIRDFCLEILYKIKEHVVTVIAGIVFLIISFVFKTYLMTVYTFAFPLWGWIVLLVVVSCLPAIILKIIDIQRRQEVLIDKDDIFNKLQWWVGQQLRFVREQTEDNKLVTWHFSVIDKRNNLSPGSAKKFLPVIFSTNPKLFPITLLNKGEKTIAIRYDL